MGSRKSRLGRQKEGDWEAVDRGRSDGEQKNMRRKEAVAVSSPAL